MHHWRRRLVQSLSLGSHCQKALLAAPSTGLLALSLLSQLLTQRGVLPCNSGVTPDLTPAPACSSLANSTTPHWLPLLLGRFQRIVTRIGPDTKLQGKNSTGKHLSCVIVRSVRTTPLAVPRRQRRLLPLSLHSARPRWLPTTALRHAVVCSPAVRARMGAHASPFGRNICYHPKSLALCHSCPLVLSSPSLNLLIFKQEGIHEPFTCHSFFRRPRAPLYAHDFPQTIYCHFLLKTPSRHFTFLLSPSLV